MGILFKIQHLSQLSQCTKTKFTSHALLKDITIWRQIIPIITQREKSIMALKHLRLYKSKGGGKASSNSFLVWKQWCCWNKWPVFNVSFSYVCSCFIWLKPDCTITARKGVIPLEVGLAFERLRVTEGVSCVTAKGHKCAYVEIIAMALTIYWNPRINTVIRLQLQGWRRDFTSNIIEMVKRSAADVKISSC